MRRRYETTITYKSGRKAYNTNIYTLGELKDMKNRLAKYDHKLEWKELG